MRQYKNITKVIKSYEKALKAISKASDKANAMHLKSIAQAAIDLKEQSEIAEYDRKLSEEAESTWRGTILSKNYKSPFQEEE